MKLKDFRLLYIGNKLQKHGKTPTSVDTLSKQFEVNFNVISVSDKLNIVLRFIDILISTIKYRNDVDAILIDTYSSLNFYIAIIVAFLAKTLKIDYYLYLHGGNLPKRLQNNPKLSAFLFKNSKQNIVPSAYLQVAFKKEGYEIEFIPNNIDISMYVFKLRKKLAPKLLYVRAFSKIYNPQMAIKAFAKVYEKYPDAKMCMVGPDKDGTLQLCKILCKQLKLEKAIEFTGKLKKKEWISRSEEFDIFINPTNFDNQPVSIIEAMALGFPIVSTNVGGLPFLIEHEQDGLLCNKDSDEQMAECVFRLLKDRELSKKLSENAKEKAIRYSWEEVELKWEKLFLSKEREK